MFKPDSRGFMPAIHGFLAALKQDVDGRDKPGHDVERADVRQFAVKFTGISCFI